MPRTPIWIQDDLMESVRFHTAALPDADIFYRSDGQEALLVTPGVSVISVYGDGATHEAPLGDWSTGHEV